MISADIRRLLWARGLRAFGDGFVSLLLPLYLITLGLSPFQVGVIATGTLLGSGVLTLLVGLHAYRLRFRTLLLMATVLMAVTGAGFAVGADSLGRFGGSSDGTTVGGESDKETEAAGTSSTIETPGDTVFRTVTVGVLGVVS